MCPPSEDAARPYPGGVHDERRIVMRTLSMLGAAFALALPLLGASRPAAATDVKPIAQAVGNKDPFVITWEDTADGKLDFADDVRGVIHDLFASVQYVLTDSGQLLLVQKDGSKVVLRFQTVQPGGLIRPVEIWPRPLCQSQVIFRVPSAEHLPVHGRQLLRRIFPQGLEHPVGHLLVSFGDEDQRSLAQLGEVL
jgi:hypothetical protein